VFASDASDKSKSTYSELLDRLVVMRLYICLSREIIWVQIDHFHSTYHAERDPIHASKFPKGSVEPVFVAQVIGAILAYEVFPDRVIVPTFLEDLPEPNFQLLRIQLF
jgi:hypothetical protein